MLMASCGNFMTVCKDDTQCAFNTCMDGFCRGVKPSGTMSTASMPIAASMNGTATAYATGATGATGVHGNGSTRAPTGTHSSPAFPGAATRETAGVMAVLFAAAAWVL